MEFKFSSADVNKHSAAHVLAAAVKRVFPDVKVGIGPVTRSGFFYDLELEKELDKDDLEKIQKEIDALIEEDLLFQQVSMDREMAQQALTQAGQIYKAELLRQIPDEQVSFYKLGSEFTDLCRGPHVSHTSEIGIVKIDSFKKVHWLDNPEKSELTRIFGHVFKDNAEYVEFIEFKKQLKEENFIVRGLRTNLLTSIKKDDEEFVVYTEHGNTIENNIANLIDSYLFQDPNIKAYFVTKPSLDLQTKDFLDLIYKRSTRSYKKLPLILYTSTESMFDYNSRKVQETNRFYQLYFDTMHNHMVSNTFFDKIIASAKRITKDEIKVDIETSDLNNRIVDSFTNYLSKSIVSHNKILTKNEQNAINLKFKASKGNSESLIYEVTYFENTSLQTRNRTNEDTPITTILVNIHLTKIFKFLVEAFAYDIPFLLKPIQIIFIPQNKSLHQSVGDFVQKMNIPALYSYTVDTTSKSIHEKIFNAEKRKIDFICIIGEKELKNNAISLRQNNQLIGLINITNFLEKVKEYSL